MFSLKRFFSFGKKESVEECLIRAFLKEPQTYWKPLADYFQGLQTPFWRRGNMYYSKSGKVAVENDMYFYVRIGDVGYDIQTHPDAYELRRWQGEHLFGAILSCVPGTSGHVAKVEQRIKEQEHGAES